MPRPNYLALRSGLLIHLAVACGFLGTGNNARAQCPDPKPLTIHLMLAGSFDADQGIMHDSLRAHNLIPLEEPYTALGYTHRGGGGGELMHASLLGVTGPHAIVDWLVVELRHANDPGKRIATQSALLLRNGEVLAANAQPLSFCVPAGRYQVAVRHRNHLGVITNRSVLLDGNPMLVDFTSSDARYNTRGGTEALQPLNADSTAWGLWPGDVSFDGRVQYVGEGNDRDPILLGIGGNVPTNVITEVYAQPDVNLDSRLQYVGDGNDRDPILVAIGGSTPTHVREDFIPDDSLVFRPNVHFVDSTSWVLNHAQSELDSGNVMVFDVQGTMPIVEPGHTLVVYAAGGWIRVVTDVSVNGSTLTIESEPGDFTDIIESGELQYELRVNSDEAISSFGPLNVTLPSGSGIQGGLFDFTNAFDLDFDERATMNPAGFVEVERGIKGSIVANGRLFLQGQLSTPAVESPPLFLGAVPLPGPFGIPLLVHFTLQASMEGNVAITTGYDLQFNLNGTVRAGVREGGGISSNYFQWAVPTPSFSVEDAGAANINFGAEIDGFLKATLLVGGSPVGGYIEIGPSLRMETAWSESGHHTALMASGKVTMGVGLQHIPEGQTEEEEWAVEGSWSTSPVIEWKAPGRVEYVTGSDQVGALEAALPEPIVARALTTLVVRGNEVTTWPSAGDNVKFEPCPTCGTVSPTEEPTQADGTAQRTWTLGSGQPGVSTQTMVVSLLDGNGSHVQGSPFSVAAEVSPLRLEYISGNHQQGIPNMDLPDGLLFRVVTDDESATPVPNITVDIDVVSGGGEAIAEEVITDYIGEGQAGWLLGEYSDGDQLLVISLLDHEGNHVTGSPLEYTATFRPITIHLESGDHQIGSPNTALMDDLQVRLTTDMGLQQFNMIYPVPGVTVLFEPEGGGLIMPSMSTTDPDGRASASWTLGECMDGTQRMLLSLDLPSTVPHNDTFFVAGFDTLTVDFALPSGNRQAGTSFQPLPLPIRVKVSLPDGEPAPYYPVGFSVTSGGGSVTSVVETDSEGVAEAIWTLGNTAVEQTVEALVLDTCGLSTTILEFHAEPPCPATMTDFDENEYDVVNLCGTCVTQENLRVSHSNDGAALQESPTEQDWYNAHWVLATYGYNTDPIGFHPSPFGATGGNLYMGWRPMNLCPIGWKVPSADEWKEFLARAAYLNITWSDTAGFRLVHSGQVDEDGIVQMDETHQFWADYSGSFNYITGAAALSEDHTFDGVYQNAGWQGFPCRCIRESP